MRFLRSGKNATNIDKASGAYDYRKVIDQLCIETYQGEEVLVLDGCRLVVPAYKRDAILALLHTGQSGIAKTYRTATQLYYWPSMRKDIELRAMKQRQSNPWQSMGGSESPKRGKTAKATHSMRPVLRSRQTMARPGRQIFRLRLGHTTEETGHHRSDLTP